MGIRYHAYAFDRDLSDQVMIDPRGAVSNDPLADAWGFEPHAMEAITTVTQAVPHRDMLYLDNAWRELQAVTGPSPARGVARPSFRMFEGDVAWHGWRYTGWVRAILPDEVAEIRDDLMLIDEADVRERAVPRDTDELAYVLDYLHRGQEFINGVACEGRGIVYVIQ